jgi:DnaJ-related protein SCJ1
MIAPGFIQQFQTPCGACSGRGKIFKTTCGTCSGKKVRRVAEAVGFKLPAGAPENFVIVKIFC